MASTLEFLEGKTIHCDCWQLLLGIPCSVFRIRTDLVMSLDIARFLLEKFLILGMGNGVLDAEKTDFHSAL
ncbi:MAG: hypothetical protein V7L20_01280 [Nostoc sp.]|uniref:hypothetical protein n=1 Tax=Nostoc sp. TaxID=1180 RepID=UPI002FFCE3E6